MVDDMHVIDQMKHLLSRIRKNQESLRKDQENLLEQVLQQLERIDQERRAQIARIDQLERTVSDLGSELGKHAASIARLGPAATQRRKDLVSSTSLVHTEIASGLSLLRDQDLTHAAIRACEHARQSTADENNIARHVSVLAHALFTLPDTANVGVLDTHLHEKNTIVDLTILQRLLDRVRRLRADAQRSGDPHQWYFGFQSGVLDPAFQKPWTGCDPHGIIKGVVTPAYVVSGSNGQKWYEKQRVFTSPTAVAPSPADAKRNAKRNANRDADRDADDSTPPDQKKQVRTDDSPGSPKDEADS